jgi:hypothetical protein
MKEQQGEFESELMVLRLGIYLPGYENQPLGRIGNYAASRVWKGFRI